MIDGGLFTLNFLLEGICETEAWRSLDASQVNSVRLDILPRLKALGARKNPNEAETEEDVVYPILEALGWQHKDVQPNASAKARADVPDALLYADLDAKNLAGPLTPWKRFEHGLCVVEAKRWQRALDREEGGRKADPGTPSSQMLRYLRRIDDLTKGKLRWGILTSGRVWRLYFHGALSVADDFLEIDLGWALALPGCEADLLDKRPDAFASDDAWREHALRLFILLFGRHAFLPEVAGETFHALALREGKRWEEKVAETLSDTVFEVIFPVLATGLAKADPLRPTILSEAYLAEVRQGALILLYRLLFVLYAEDRNLLPDEDRRYAPYCLTRMRLDIAERRRVGGGFPQHFTTFWPRILAIFGAIAEGNDDLGIPPYNGGLFDSAAAPILDRVQLSDAVVGEVVFGLSHAPTEREPKYINYRDLSVQQLGAVYERILEFGLRAAESGDVEVDADDEARHRSGSYYTPEELVSLVIGRAVGPLIEERVDQFRSSATALADDSRAVADRLENLAGSDPATAILGLKICDPAIGSGHFLVSLVDWLADKVLDAMAEAPALVGWAQYVSPLAARIATIREKILGEARVHNWPIVESQLDDRHVVRRMVLKRVVYGVDKNPMAVELAKVALWLHSFTVGAPLSFLDHHLRVGDSVLGAWVHPTVEALQKRGALFNLGQITRVESVSGVMADIEAMTDNDVTEVAASKEKFGTVENVTEPIAALFSLLTAERILGVFDGAPKRPFDPRKLVGKSDKQIAKARADEMAFERAAALQLVLEGTFGDPMRIAEGKDRVAPPDLVTQLALLPDAPPDQSSLFPAISVDDRRRVKADALVEESRALADRETFFHWEIGFPNVWSNLTSSEPRGGFDAVIGNPPYIRQELLGDGAKRALKKAYAAYDGMADLYVYFYEQGLRLLKPGGRMSYVVTNKWLKAGYAEELRALFADRGWLEFIADFGHAKHFFPDADVFPSMLVMRKPDIATPAPVDADVCVIPRDAVPRKGLARNVAESTFSLPRAMFTKESWVLEPKPVLELLTKIRRNGLPLVEVAGAKPLYGIKTGLNDAYLIDSAKRDELVRNDPSCVDIIKPYLRGQDLERWCAPDTSLFMIVVKSSSNHSWPWAQTTDENAAEAIFKRTYPSVHGHLKLFEEMGFDRKTKKPIGLRHREDHGRFWWELRPCDYYDEFEKPKILYVDIMWSTAFAIDDRGTYVNNTCYFLPNGDEWLAAVLNAPIGWYFAWRRAQHGKDEALRYFTSFLEEYPIPRCPESFSEGRAVSTIADLWRRARTSETVMGDWLRHEFGLAKQGAALTDTYKLSADSFVAAVRQALPRSKELSGSDVTRLKKEWAKILGPARHAASQAMLAERRLADLVNNAYGLNAEEVALMWETAPPRMPFTPI